MPGSQVDCPFCQVRIAIPPLTAAVRATCPQCQKQFIVDVAGKVVTEAQVSAQALTKQMAAPPKPQLIPVVCFRCGTRIYAEPAQIGTKLQCPDCHSLNEVRPPPPAKPASPATAPKPPVAEDEYQLDSSPPPPRSSVVSSTLINPDDADDLVLREAEEITKPAVRLPTPEEIDRETEFSEDWRPQTVDQELQPFVRGVINFLFHPEAIGRWTSLGLGAAVVSVLAHFGVMGMQVGGFMGMLSALGMTVAAVVIGALVLAPTAASVLRIVADTANEIQRIENWPGWNFFEWLGDAILLIAALGYAAVPGLLLSSAWSVDGVSALVWLAPPALTIWMFLPLLLLSMLEENSLVAIYSSFVYQTLRKASDGLLLFYFQTAWVVFALFICCWLQSLPEVLMTAVAAFLMVPLLFLYARFIGRLMVVCQLKKGGNLSQAPAVTAPQTAGREATPGTASPPSQPSVPTPPSPVVRPPAVAAAPPTAQAPPKPISLPLPPNVKPAAKPAPPPPATSPEDLFQ